MNEDDPIQRLLQNTGWSCEDLLERLQKYKSAKSDTTPQLNLETEKPKDKPEAPLTINRQDEPMETESIIPEEETSKPESFSGTDEEEEAVNATSSSIINEIIEDIKVTEEVGEPKGPEIKDTEIPEVTEVRVIELQDDDQNQEEERQENILNPEEIERLEKYQNVVDPKPVKKIETNQQFTVIRKLPAKDGKNSNVKILVPIEAHRVQPRSRPVMVMKKKLQRIDTTSLQATNPPNSVRTLAENVSKTPIKFCPATLAENIISKTPIKFGPMRTSPEPPFSIHADTSLASLKKIIRHPPKKIFIRPQQPIVPAAASSTGSPMGNGESTVPNNNFQKLFVTAAASSTSSPVGNGEATVPKNNFQKLFVPILSKPKETVPIQKAMEDSEEEHVEEENTSSEAFEKIRNNLKLQLSSLRTKKRSQLLDTTSTQVIDNIQCSKKLSLLESLETAKKMETAKENNDTMASDNVGEFSTQTNDLGLVILNVQGGVDLEEAEKVEKEADKVEKEGDKAEERVFNEIRKIINKQKLPPKLSISKSNDNANCLQKRLPKTDEDKKMDISCENSETSFPEIEEKSPFVSDSLDEFLTASKLNISYQIPKLGAEEGLKNITEESPLILKRVEHVKDEDLKENSEARPKLITTLKAKTVAQKRRLLEKERRKELRKQKKKAIKDLKERVKEVTKEIEDIKQKKNGRSYVLCNDNKIWIKSNVINKCIAKIDCSKKTSPKVPQRKKLSLLQQNCNKQPQVQYKPGPLCKKTHLQVTGKEKWETRMLKLPKIYLELFPQRGKTFSDVPMHRLSNIIGGNLDRNKIEFALTALLTKSQVEDKTVRKFRFPLHYHNKVDQVLTRRQKTVLQENKVDQEPVKKVGVVDEIAEVIEGLIRYVEIKELAPSLIKDDVKPTPEKSINSTDSPTNENVTVFKKPHKRRSKVESELLRLSCKVVNVEVEENQNEVVCSKPHCQLGCVCKSLKCDYVVGLHCQKPSCMFKCTCPEEKPMIYEKLTFPPGTNLLSEDTVNRIEDEAKKHLAKVEKEFTQTVIHTNDKTIVVGIGDRTKTRRTARLPAKFTDFVPTASLLNENEDAFKKTCVVSLARLNLSDIIPLCLTHNVYECSCKGYAIIKDQPSIETRTRRHKNNVSIKFPPESDHSSLDEPIDQDKPIRNLKRKSLSSDNGVESCARVTQISKKYKRSLKYSQNIYQDDFVNKVNDSDLLKVRLQVDAPSNTLSESDLLKHSLLGEKLSLELGKNKMKRKQKLESRKDISPSFNWVPAIQRRKKLTSGVQVVPVFEGEIIIDRSNLELLTKMGPRTVSDGYARLLPWTSLINGYYKKTIRIWSMVDQPSRLLINTAEKKCPKNYIDIRRLSTATEVIGWIKNKQLPSYYHEDSLSFILKETKNNFEICGICTKNIVQKVEQSSEEEKELDNSEIFFHKDLTGVERFFILKKEQHKMITLEEDIPEYYQARLTDVQVALPSTNDCKWRMLILNSDFSFFLFRSISYSIRYTDLLAIVHYSKTKNCTVRLKNKDLNKSYKHSLFGIYFDPRLSDRIFIGPYTDSCDTDDVETLRYINQTLVSTKSFNIMRGKGDYKCGHWMIEKNYDAASETATSADNTIDLTSDNEQEFGGETVCEITKHPSDKEEYYPFAPKIIHNKQEIRIIDAPPRKPEDFNRYIITNIPHFGYLGAYMHPHGELDVSWPFENKLLRFCSESAAVSFLQDRFSSLLQSVPESFKIHIIVSLNVDLNVYHPIDSGVLNGHYICGEFGYMNILETSEEDCETKIGVAKEEILKLFSKRAQNFVRKKLETLSYLLQIPKNKNGYYNLPVILRTAAKEIQQQIEKEREYRTLKNHLMLKKRENALKLHKLLAQLPAAERNIENRKFRANFNKTEPLPIVINDSDDERGKKETETGVFKTPQAKPATQTLKSILKPLVTVPVGKDNILLRMDLKCLEERDPLELNPIPLDKPKYIPGVKLVRNAKGGFVLINEDTKSEKTEVVIKDGKIFNVGTNLPETCTTPEESDVCEPLFIDVTKHTSSESPLKLLDESEGEGKTSEVIDIEDDDVIPVENEQTVIDLDDFPSDNE